MDKETIKSNIEQLKDDYVMALKETLEKTENRVTNWINKYSDLEEKYFKLEREINNSKFIKIKDLREEIELLKKENKELKQKNIQKLKNEKEKIHNERGAGRKKSFDEERFKKIEKLRSEGMTVKAIAEKLNLSMSTVNRYLKKGSE